MSSSGGPARGPAQRPVTPSTRALVDLRRLALDGAAVLLEHVPDTGDHRTGRVVDAFVEQASDALRALGEGAGATLAAVGSEESTGSQGAGGPGLPDAGVDAVFEAAERLTTDEPPRGGPR